MRGVMKKYRILYKQLHNYSRRQTLDLVLLSEMDSSTSLEEKRMRKKNFIPSEIRVLVEEVANDGPWLMAKNNAKITNKKKEARWIEIAIIRVSACGAATRSWIEVREKFKKLRSDVINRQRELKRTGGGKPPPEIPYEDIILYIIGSGSNLVKGIAGGE